MASDWVYNAFSLMMQSHVDTTDDRVRARG